MGPVGAAGEQDTVLEEKYHHPSEVSPSGRGVSGGTSLICGPRWHTIVGWLRFHGKVGAEPQTVSLDAILCIFASSMAKCCGMMSLVL